MHLGENANNGHIFTYIRSPDNLWYKANDELVTPVNLNSVLNDNNSYILCYARLSEEKQNLWEPENNIFYTQSARFMFSSTPKRLNGPTNTDIDTYSPVRKKIFYFQYIFM